jgi:hypothetical protein
MSQDTGLWRNPKDQFYTRPEIAKLCVDFLRLHVTEDLPWVEPSAGDGVFLSLVESAVGYDIEPRHPRVQQADFLTVDLPQDCVIYGNPPFGRQASLAKQFIQHAATRAKWIGFILPLSFTKPSMQKAIPPMFHLIASMTLPETAFRLNETPYSVPCVFQVWMRRDEPREPDVPEAAVGFSYVKRTDPYTLAFRRVGANAGRCSLPATTLSAQTHYFLRLDEPSSAASIVDESQTHSFPTNTTGPRSLSKGEANRFLNAAIARATAARN